MFVVPTIGFKLLYCLMFLAHGRRELVHHAVTADPTAEWIARQLTEAFPWTQRQGIWCEIETLSMAVVRRRLRALGIGDRPTASVGGRLFPTAAPFAAKSARRIIARRWESAAPLLNL